MNHTEIYSLSEGITMCQNLVWSRRGSLIVYA
ncbi:hypothetical protein B0G57_10377 [Trinickia symbiotica]|nr:hypothetical protein B0G57_10377 [Trinickia symbiotica]